MEDILLSVTLLMSIPFGMYCLISLLVFSTAPQVIYRIVCPKLMEQLNANIHYQIFRGIRISSANPVRLLRHPPIPMLFPKYYWMGTA